MFAAPSAASAEAHLRGSKVNKKNFFFDLLFDTESPLCIVLLSLTGRLFRNGSKTGLKPAKSERFGYPRLDEQFKPIGVEVEGCLGKAAALTANPLDFGIFVFGR